MSYDDPMLADYHPVDTKYDLEAYEFVQKGLTFAVKILQMNQSDSRNQLESGDSLSDENEPHLLDSGVDEIKSVFEPAEPFPTHPELIDLPNNAEDDNASAAESAANICGIPSTDSNSMNSASMNCQSGACDEDQDDDRHLTGQQLCEALRRFAIHQFGFMAKLVLANWGITSTSDFGEIVYTLIEAGCMKKSEEDRKEHFDDVYDFDVAFEQEFQINQPAIFWPG